MTQRDLPVSVDFLYQNRNDTEKHREGAEIHRGVFLSGTLFSVSV